MSRGAVVLGFGLIGLMLGMLGGCSGGGYHFGATHRTDVKTVAVPVFENTTFSHGLEITLTDAIIKEIHRVTPWRVAAREQADTTLTGAITSSDLRKLSRQSETGMVQEVAVELIVTFEWKLNRTGEVLVTRRNFRAADVFTPSRGAQERLDLGEQAAVDRLAKDIVSELRSSW